MSQDCVVVPGLGAFVSRYVPATLSPDGSSIVPPGREVSFNAALSHDDGMLIASMTRREGISYDSARDRLEQEVELINRRLRNEGMLTLPRIGSFTLTPHDTLEFSPDTENSVAALPFAGLYPLNLTPLVPAIEADMPEEVAAEPVIMPLQRRRFMAMPALKYAASAAVLLGACLTFLTPLAPEGFDLASLQPRTQTIADTQFSEVDNAKYAGKEITLYRIDPLDNAPIETVTSESAKQQENSSVNHTPIPRYYVIVASCSTLKEARRYVKMHSTAATPLGILPSEGRYRVYAAAGNDFNAMSAYRTASAEFASKNPNAWVYTYTTKR